MSSPSSKAMDDNADGARHPKMIYWTSRSGIIVRAESDNGYPPTLKDPLFSAPFATNQIIGCNIFHFMEGLEVRHIYRVLSSQVLQTGRTIKFHYRCDSPAIRREMSMQLSRDAEMVRYESTVVLETRRDREIRQDTPGAPALVALCSFCKNYRFPLSSAVWKELEDLMKETGLPDQFSFTHGVCPGCYRKAIKEP